MHVFRTMVALMLWAVAAAGFAADGLIALKSPHAVKDTMDRLEAAVTGRGLNVFLRLDHAAGAQKIGKKLPPTELLVFGSPQGGTPLMECAQTAGIDLPLKALVWQDASGQAWLGYNDPRFIAKRHETANCPVAPVLLKVMEGLAAEAVR